MGKQNVQAEKVYGIFVLLITEVWFQTLAEGPPKTAFDNKKFDKS